MVRPARPQHVHNDSNTRPARPKGGQNQGTKHYAARYRRWTSSLGDGLFHPVLVDCISNILAQGAKLGPCATYPGRIHSVSTDSDTEVIESGSHVLSLLYPILATLTVRHTTAQPIQTFIKGGLVSRTPHLDSSHNGFTSTVDLQVSESKYNKVKDQGFIMV